MLFTISKPHTKHGKKLEGRVSKKFISFQGLAKEDDYVQLIPGTYKLLGDYPKIEEQVFMPESNRQSYLVKSSDSNITLPSPIMFEGDLYEPVIAKIWIPDMDILNSVLDTISTTAYLRHIQKDSTNMPRKSLENRTFDDWMMKYNKDILKEQQRREEFKQQNQNYEKALELFEKSPMYNHLD